MSKLKLMYLIVILIATLLVSFSRPSYAISINSIITGGDKFISSGQAGGTDSSGNKLSTFDNKEFSSNIQSIFRIFTTVGIAVSVIISGILGIKIMIASAEEKAEIKEKLVPYIIGCAVTFGAFTIWKIVMNIANSVG